MNEYISILKTSDMFSGIKEEEILAMIRCLSARVSHYKKNEYILRNGKPVHSVGMVLSGLALVEKVDLWGNRTIIQEIIPGMIFAESYACLSQVPVETSVLASTDSSIMFFNISRLLTVCTSACNFHTRIIQNLLGTIAQKNVSLTKKMDYMTKKTIRERLLSYLSTESLKAGSSSFTIPFDRQELADYLSVDRSALSNEISKLQKEGILSSQKKEFHIYKHSNDSIDIFQQKIFSQ